MKNKALKNLSTSVHSRLLNLARSSGRDFNELCLRYSVERFLARLAASIHAERFILKGAMLYIPWKLDDKRTTMDLDLLGFGSTDLDHLKEVFRQICASDLEDDGLVFDTQSLAVARIREEAIYAGARVIIRVTMGTMPIKLQVDVGFGDQVVPAPQCAEFPALLAAHGPVIRSYSPETVIAEKFNAMIELGMANSRMKDYFDIWMLSRNFVIEQQVLSEAIQQTFSKRRTPLPQAEPIALSDEFMRNDSKQTQWKGFLRKQRRLDIVPDLAEIIEELRNFLLPLVALSTKAPADNMIWYPLQGWRSK